jgi:hypothetical protein
MKHGVSLFFLGRVVTRVHRRAWLMRLSPRSDLSTSVLDLQQYSTEGGNRASPILLFLQMSLRDA